MWTFVTWYHIKVLPLSFCSGTNKKLLLGGPNGRCYISGNASVHSIWGQERYVVATTVSMWADFVDKVIVFAHPTHPQVVKIPVICHIFAHFQPQTTKMFSAWKKKFFPITCRSSRSFAQLLEPLSFSIYNRGKLEEYCNLSHFLRLWVFFSLVFPSTTYVSWFWRGRTENCTTYRTDPLKLMPLRWMDWVIVVAKVGPSSGTKLTTPGGTAISPTVVVALPQRNVGNVRRMIANWAYMEIHRLFHLSATEVRMNPLGIDFLKSINQEHL